MDYCGTGNVGHPRSREVLSETVPTFRGQGVVRPQRRRDMGVRNNPKSFGFAYWTLTGKGDEAWEIDWS
jgi:hypothetical protein